MHVHVCGLSVVNSSFFICPEVARPVSVLLTTKRNAVQYFYPDDVTFDSNKIYDEQMTSLAYMAHEQRLFMLSRQGELYEMNHRQQVQQVRR